MKSDREGTLAPEIRGAIIWRTAWLSVLYRAVRMVQTIGTRAGELDEGERGPSSHLRPFRRRALQPATRRMQHRESRSQELNELDRGPPSAPEAVREPMLSTYAGPRAEAASPAGWPIESLLVLSPRARCREDDATHDFDPSGRFPLTTALVLRLTSLPPAKHVRHGLDEDDQSGEKCSVRQDTLGSWPDVPAGPITIAGTVNVARMIVDRLVSIADPIKDGKERERGKTRRNEPSASWSSFELNETGQDSPVPRRMISTSCSLEEALIADMSIGRRGRKRKRWDWGSG